MKNSNLPLILIGAVVLLVVLTRKKEEEVQPRDPITNRNLTPEEYAEFNAVQAAGNSLLRCGPEGCAY